MSQTKSYKFTCPKCGAHDLLLYQRCDTTSTTEVVMGEDGTLKYGKEEQVDNEVWESHIVCAECEEPLVLANGSSVEYLIDLEDWLKENQEEEK